MTIIDFTHSHAAEAAALALQHYKEERGSVPALPDIGAVPDLFGFADNGMGVAAFDGGGMVGFLCGYGPWDNAWNIPGLRNVFSPMGANGTVKENRAKIYARLYQAAAEKWVAAGAVSHAVCLYAHDRAENEQFYRYGFGIRCMDAIRGMDAIGAPQCEGYEFAELMPKNVLEILPLENMHVEGYLDSPFFMYRAKSDETTFLQNYEHSPSIYFVAKFKGKSVAYIKAELDGETFIRETPRYFHVNGAYCLPEHRGRGVSHKLLALLVQKLKSQGYTRLGVIFESFNPLGSNFWLKHFTAYTHSVVRRIDESVLGRV